ncbi:MAG: YajQ family cyclic di-GMP-binding protein [Candidatus Saccharimonadales bacterium]
MATFSFDIVSEYDKAEMNNVFLQAEKEIANRYDFKGTPAAIEWLGDKKGFKIIGSNEWQIDAVSDIVRKKLATREISSKVLDLKESIHESNLKASKDIPFVEGLSQDKAKQLTKTIRDQFPKAKPQIQGEAVRVTSGSKDELQAIMAMIRAADLDFVTSFINFR